MSEASISGRAEVFAAEQYFDEEGHQESGGIGELYCHRWDHSISSHVGHLDQGWRQSKCEENSNICLCFPSTNSSLFCPLRPADWSKSRSQNWVTSEGRGSQIFSSDRTWIQLSWIFPVLINSCSYLRILQGEHISVQTWWALGFGYIIYHLSRAASIEWISFCLFQKL